MASTSTDQAQARAAPARVSLPAVPASVRRARETVADIAAQAGASQSVVDDVRLCISEAATNVVRHAYAARKGEIRIAVDASEDELTVLVADDGVGLELFQREGELGHGLRIIDQLTRTLSVTSAANAGTQLRMVFALQGLAPEHEHRRSR